MATVRAAVLFPLETIASADDANGTALVTRGAQRDIEVDLSIVHSASSLPRADVYLLGGTGDTVGALVTQLTDSSTFVDRVQEGAAVLAVDAGMDALSRGLTDRSGRLVVPGLGLLDAISNPGPAVDGSVVTRAYFPGAPTYARLDAAQPLSIPGSGREPLRRAPVPAGGGAAHGWFLHRPSHRHAYPRPTLARNPELADVLLGLGDRNRPV